MQCNTMQSVNHRVVKHHAVSAQRERERRGARGVVDCTAATSGGPLGVIPRQL